MRLINSYLAFISAFHFSKSRQRYCNLVCTKRKKERKTGEIPKDRICSDQDISDILLIWKPGFRNDDGGEILESLSKYDVEEQ